VERVSLVTGANRGIGLEIARQLAMRGFTTVLGARDAQKGKRAASLLQQSGLEVIPVQLDVTEQKSIDGARQIVEERFGKADELRGSRILVNSVCPGWVATDMGGAGAPRAVEEGAASVMWAATLPDDGPTGGFFRDGKQLPW